MIDREAKLIEEIKNTIAEAERLLSLDKIEALKLIVDARHSVDELFDLIADKMPDVGLMDVEE